MSQINKYLIFIFLLFFYACNDNKSNNSSPNKSIVLSDTIILKFVDVVDRPIEKGLVGIRFKDSEEQTSSILASEKTILKIDSTGILKLNKASIAKEYRVELSDRLSAFYFLSPDIYQAFVLDLNRDSIIIRVANF